MEVNIENLKKLLEEKFFNNKSLMARTIGIEVSHITKVFSNNGNGAGAKFCGSIIRYCEDNNLNYKNYIFFDTQREKNHKRKDR